MVYLFKITDRSALAFCFFALYKCTYLLSFVRCSMRFADVISLRAAAWAGRGGASRDRRGGKQRGAAL